MDAPLAGSSHVTFIVVADFATTFTLGGAPGVLYGAHTCHTREAQRRWKGGMEG